MAPPSARTGAKREAGYTLKRELRRIPNGYSRAGTFWLEVKDRFA